MTQPSEAVGGEATPAAETNAVDVFTKLAEETFGVTDEEQEPAEGEPVEGEPEADDEPTLEEEADDLPPIEAPVSWDADAKAKFAELPRELQETVTKREAERERFVQSKSQEAAQARQTAAQQAQAELAQISATYAQHYQQIADAVQVSEPDPMLQVQDPIAYAQQMRAYQQANAQRSAAQQAAQQHAQQAQWQAMQAHQAEMARSHQIIVEQFPEYADPTTGPQWIAKLSSVAKDVLGYPPELVDQARVQDILAMRAVYDLKVKADKYDGLMGKKMANVRAAKGLPKVATPGVAQGSDQLRARTAQAALEVAKSSNNREAKGAAFFDYLSKSGQI